MVGSGRGVEIAGGGRLVVMVGGGRVVGVATNTNLGGGCNKHNSLVPEMGQHML